MANYAVKLDDSAHLDRLINETDKSSVLINRIGCETIGYRIFDKQNNRELALLHRDSEVEPPKQGWKNHATVLFPFIGRLIDNKSRLGDKIISNPGLHGFARRALFAVVDSETKGRAAIHYRLTANAETRKLYPFEFQFDITYALKGNILTATFEIRNPADKEDLYYSFGWHPGFRTPVIDGLGTKMGCQVLFNKGVYKSHLVDKDCNLTGEVKELQLDGPLQTTEEELQGTILLEIEKPENRLCTLRDPLAGLDLAVDFKDFPHVGLWADVGVNFICIEPWQGMDDHVQQRTFDQKFGIMKLAPGEVDRRNVTVTPRFKKAGKKKA
jgi:galactose mutarotase-like enzyme